MTNTNNSGFYLDTVWLMSVHRLRQFPLETESEYDVSALHVMTYDTNACNFAVGDPVSGTVLFKSRIVNVAKVCRVFQ
jgi:hypothetical protein